MLEAVTGAGVVDDAGHLTVELAATLPASAVLDTLWSVGPGLTTARPVADWR